MNTKQRLAALLVTSLLAVVLFGSTTTSPASAQSCPPLSTTVYSAAELDTAISCYNDPAAPAGAYVITLGGIIDYTTAAGVSARGVETITQSAAGFSLVIEGDNFGIHGSGGSNINGGVIRIEANAQPVTVNQIRITGSGGIGVLARNPSTTITNSTLEGSGSVGVLVSQNFGGLVTVANSNISSYSHGIRVVDGDAHVNDSTIRNVSAGVWVGEDDTAEITNSTITLGGGEGVIGGPGSEISITSSTINLFDGEGVSSDGFVTVNSSVIEHGCFGTISGSNNFVGPNLVGGPCGSSTTVTTAPLPFPADLGCAIPTPTGCVTTVALPAGHPAIDAGPACANGASTDQRGAGFPRNVGGGCDAGAFEADLSTPADLRPQFLTVAPAVGERLGSVLATGDFNGDGFADVAVSAPPVGEVTFFEGTSVGLVPGETITRSAGFGSALAVGDFDGDGRDDVAIGDPTKAFITGQHPQSGSVTIRYGNGSFLEFNGSFAGVPGSAEADDRLGSSLAAGDFNGDGYDDLAVGIPGEDLGTTVDAGAVIIFNGVPGRLKVSGSRWLSGDSPGVPGVGEAGDEFGGALTAGDFNGDGFADLAVGAPTEDVGAKQDAGSVIVFEGTATGIDSALSRWISGDSTGVPGAAEPGDRFGTVLAAGDLTADGRDELIVGVPNEALGSRQNAGAGLIFAGSGTGVQKSGSIWISGDSAGVPGVGETGDRFGSAFALGDVDGDGTVDLVVGVPGEALGLTVEAGAVLSFRNTGAGVGNAGATWLSGQSVNMPGWGEAGDEFGAALAIGAVDGSSNSLVIGIPGEAIGNFLTNAGAFIELVPA